MAKQSVSGKLGPLSVLCGHRRSRVTDGRLFSTVVPIDKPPTRPAFGHSPESVCWCFAAPAAQPAALKFQRLDGLGDKLPADQQACCIRFELIASRAESFLVMTISISFIARLIGLSALTRLRQVSAK